MGFIFKFKINVRDLVIFNTKLFFILLSDIKINQSVCLRFNTGC